MTASQPWKTAGSMPFMSFQLLKYTNTLQKEVISQKIFA